MLPIQLNELPMIYITGGNLGSHIINKTVANALNQLTRKYIIIHQCGFGKKGRDFVMLLQTRDALSEQRRKRYLVKEWFADQEVAWLLRNASLVISRAGANIVTELALIGTKALLIPLPISGKNEQLYNALLLKNAGTAEILKQDNLTVPTLLKTVFKMQEKESIYRKCVLNAKKMVKPNAAEELVNLILKVYEEKKAKV